jgi:PAS domain S-box-containing protein
VLILALAVPGAALSVLVATDVTSELRVQSERENQLVALMVARSVKEQFDGLKMYVRSYAERIKFSESVCARDTAFARLVISQMTAGSALVSRVFLADTSGTIWLDTPSDPHVLGQNFAHRSWFRGVSQANDVYVSEIYRRQALGQPYTIAVACRVYDLTRRYCGILVAQVTIDDLAHWFFELPLPADRTIALVDQSGHWIDNTQAGNKAINFDDTITFRALLVSPFYHAELKDPISGAPGFFSTVPVGTAGWTVVSRQELDQIAGSSFALQRTIILYFIAGLGAMILIGGSMFNTLRRYDDERDKAQDSLQRAYAGVEEEVHNRTSELTTANRELQRLAAIIESSNDAIGSSTLDGTVTSWNEAAESMYGYRAGEIVGRPASILLPDDRGSETADYLKQIAIGKKLVPIETIRRRKDGRMIHVSLVYSPVRDDEGRIVGASIVARDITQQKTIEAQTHQLEQERAELLERLQMTFDRMPIGCILNDTDFRFTYWNPAAEKIFGYSFNEVKGRHPFGIITPPSSEKAVTSVFKQLAEGGFDVDAVGENITKDGRRITCVWNNTSLRDRAGRFIGIISMCQDVTEQKKDEERLRVYASALAQNNRELQDFAFVASHDLQEPLRKITAFGDRLQTATTGILDAESREYLDRMQKAAQRMQTLIKDLLDFSRVATHAQPFVSTELKSIAAEVVSDLETRIEQSRGTVIVGELPSIEADPVQMRQLLQNLIANALKFHRSDVPPVVRVTAVISNDSTAEPSDAKTCQVSIEDNGIGFDMKYIDRIFTPFQRLHGRHEFEGSGMGLAICRKIAERHNGSITAASIPGRGSTFIITLPVYQPNAGRSLWKPHDAASASSWPTTTPTIAD